MSSESVLNIHDPHVFCRIWASLQATTWAEIVSKAQIHPAEVSSAGANFKVIRKHAAISARDQRLHSMHMTAHIST